MKYILIILAFMIIILSFISKKYESFDKKDYAVCLWGQPRAIKSTYKNFYKYFIEPLNADLFMVLQETDTDDIKLYKKIEGKFTYHSPNGNEIYKTYDKLNKNTINNYNSESHLKILYNFNIINDKFGSLLESNYKYIILSRTDFLHLFDFPDILKLSPDKEVIWCYDGHEYGGINATLICIPSTKIREYLTFCYNFLQDENNINYLNEQTNSPYITHNIEYFLELPFKKNNWKIGKIQNNAFITADSKDEVTTWGSILYSDEHDVFYKYREQLDNTYNSLEKVKEGYKWKYINGNIDRIVLSN